MNHPLQWTYPKPLWPEVLPAPGSVIGSFAAPALLRFASDTFMDDFTAVLQRDPSQTRGFLLRYETWRGTLAQPETDKVLATERPLAEKARAIKQKALARKRLRLLPLSKSTSTAIVAASSDDKPLKLYQPAHQRYYLVTASLVCKIAGLPDHRPDLGKQERVGFVMRRLMPPDPIKPHDALPPLNLQTWKEYAFINTPHGPGWRAIDPNDTDHPEKPDTFIAGEELLPMFPVGYHEEDGRRRNLFAGFVPVGRREAYQGAPKRTPASAAGDSGPAPTRKSARMALFRTQIAEPWKRLIELAFQANAEANESIKGGTNESIDAANKRIESTRVQIQIASWLVLLEFAEYLQKYVPDVWSQIMAQTPVSNAGALLTELQRTVFDNSAATALSTDTAFSAAKVARSLRDALAKIQGDRPFSESKAKAVRDMLDRVTVKFDRAAVSDQWPDFLFPLADPKKQWSAVDLNTQVNELDRTEGVDGSPRLDDNAGQTSPATQINGHTLSEYRDRVDKLMALVVRALPDETTEDVPALPLAAQPILDFRDSWFVIRCVFDRPNCGPLHPDVVSQPTQPFKLASFFDPDAPARPIRIALPIDTTPAGLRKFNKNTAFMISDVLCGQVQRAKGMSFGDLVRSVLPWPLHKDLSAGDTGPCKDPTLALGMICSLSIPIITICAFILLMIIVNLLDIIFRWMPWFITCFPLPGFRAKR